jgi:GNAT superfamily N-acetyltransferase
MSTETCRRVARCALYRPELDLGIVGPDGSVVAFALAWFDPPSGSATFEPIGCVPVWQRKGLSSALMREGLVRLRALGAQTAWVTTSRRRAGANRLYVSLGFVERGRSREWVSSH